MSWIRTIAVAALLFAVSGPSFAHAQASENFEQAKTLFLEGTQAAEAHEWEKAADLFKRSYELVHRESSLLNYAVSLSELKRYVETREALQTLLHELTPAEDLRVRAQALLDTVDRKISVLDLYGMERDVSYDIEVKGRKVNDDGTRPVRVDEDPGAVSLRVSAADAEEAFTWQGTLNEGERVRVDVVLPGADGESIFESPWFWIVTGAVVAAGAAVGLYFILDGAADLEPNSKNVVNLDL